MLARIMVITLILFSAFSFAQQEQNDIQWTKLADGLSFPEGPAWNGEELVVSNCYDDWFTRIKDGIVDTFAVKPTAPDTFGATNGLTFHRSGDLYGCDFGRGAIMRFSPEGSAHVYASGYGGEAFNRPNDLAFDPEGNLYFTDPKSYNIDKPDGRIFMVDRYSGEVVLLKSGFCFPNGIAFDDNGENLYVCESVKNRVLKFPVQPDGTLGDYTVFAELPGGDPDGIAFDTNSNLWVAHFGSGTVYVLNPYGKVINQLKTPGMKPSNVEFGGKNMQTLFITEDETNAVYKTEVDAQGRILFASPLKNQ